VAPGNRILSLKDGGSYLDRNYPDNRVPVNVYGTALNLGTPDYYQLSGTSMAAPMVSSAAALLIQKDSTLTPDQVKARLMKTASKFPQATTVSFDPATGYQWTTQYDVFTIGAGYLDVAAALADNTKPYGLALSPAVGYDAASAQVYMVLDLRSIWGTNYDWSARSVWGTGSVSGTRSVWGTSAPWGSDAAMGFQTIWGERSIWGTRSVWGTDAIQALSVMVGGDL
jgi:serine protease AprX